jgi:uncharacterized coiled-coil protein SlyX
MVKEKEKEQLRDLAEDLKVNRFKLEIDCAVQPSMYHYWAEQLATARANVDKTDEKLRLLDGDLKEVKAKEELIIRAADPKDFKLDKFTEASITAVLENRPAVTKKREEIQTTRQELIDNKETVYHLEAAVKSLEHRRDELDNLTKLWLGGYYAKPEGKPETAGDQFSKESRQRLNKDKEK